MADRRVDDKASDTLVAGLRLTVLDGEFDSPPSPPLRMAPVPSDFAARRGRMDLRKETVAAGYDAIAERYVDWSTRAQDPARKRLLAEFSRLLRRGADVLDLGCGAGLPSTAELAERYRVTGVDVSAAQLQAARRNVPEATFVHGDIATVDFTERSFDGVTALYSISHVPREEHAELFRRIARWLRPRGLFLATLGANDSPDWTGEWLGERMFFSSFDAAKNRKLLTAAGFDLLLDEVVETIEPEGAVPFLWVLARGAGRLPAGALGGRTR